MTALKTSTNQYFEQAHKELKTNLKNHNDFSLPTISKISINVGVGKYEQKQKNEIKDYLQALTGQKAKSVTAKQSIAGFKLRKGDEVGLIVTLRGQAAKDFVLNLIYLSLPRTRDFKGIKSTSFNSDFSSYSIGIENASIFPAVGFDVSVNFGMQINVVFKHASEENKLLLEKLQFPFKK